MSLFDRLGNGWKIAGNSFKVLKANKQLIIFPILSGISLIVLMGSFVVALLGLAGWDTNNLDQYTTPGYYALLFVFYIVNYFVVVFFNMALVHCTSLYFKGEEVTVQKGVAFSKSRIGVIFQWALFAGSVGVLLKLIQDNVGTIGKIITGLIGVVWSVSTFFVVPIMAYENVGPLDAFKKSVKMMKEKWGESVGAGFSFGLVQLVGIIIIALVGFGLAAIHPFIGIAVAILGIMILSTIVSAAQTIFVSQVYHNITGDPVEHYNQQFIDNLFEPKSKNALGF